MGIVSVAVKVQGFEAQGPAYEARFLVDTGATDCMVPASDLRRLGIEPAGRHTYRLADESVQEYVFGLARILVDPTRETVRRRPDSLLKDLAAV